MGRRGRHADPNSKQSKAAIARAAELGLAKPTSPASAPGPAPKMPADLKARPVAAAFWKAHADALAAAGRLRAEYVHPLALLCRLHADCVELEEKLAAEGWVTASGKGQQANPTARLLRDARRDFVSLAREFGLTPAAETRFPPEAVDHGEEDPEEAALRAFIA